MSDPFSNQSSLGRDSVGLRYWGVVAAIMAAIVWFIFTSDHHTRGLFWTTTSLAGWVIFLTLPVGALVAIFLSRTDVPGGRAWPFLCAALLILPSFILISGWDAIIGPIGWAKAWLPMETALSGVRWSSAILLHSLLGLPGVILLVSLGLSRAEAELEEVSLLVSSWPGVLISVALRRAAPLLLVAALWIFVTVSGEIAVTDIYQIRTLAEELYLSYQIGGEDDLRLRGIAPFLVLVSIVAYVAISMADRALRVDAIVGHREVRRFPLAAWKWPLGLLLAALFILLLLVPLASLFYKAGLHVEYAAARPFQTWSVEHTLGTLKEAPLQFAPVLQWTFLHAILAGATALSFALLLAWMERWRPWLARINTLLLVAAIAIPGPLIGIGLLKFLSSSGEFSIYLRDRTLFAPIAASAFRVLPWIVLLLRFSFRTLPEEQLELAKLQGWGMGRTLIAIALPQRWPIVAACFIFSAALCLSEVSTTLLVVPPGVELASVRLMGMLHSGVDNQLAGLALLLVGAFVAMLIPLFWLLRRSQAQHPGA